jgi:negative regulator of flagellin synthesis FlgM
MKIESSGKSIAPSTTAEARPRAPANPENAVSASAEKVQFSSLSSSLAKAEASIAQTPVVDSKRVEEIKQAIANGEFKIDAGRIADGLIDSVREMLADQR